jgi:hypothetical protein
MSTCIHDLRPGECYLCRSDDWHEGITHTRKRVFPHTRKTDQQVVFETALREHRQHRRQL